MDDRRDDARPGAAEWAAGRFARLSRLYYFVATPVFALLDYVLGVNVRVTFLDGRPGPRVAYYAIAIGCGIVGMLRPRLAAVVGLTESAANICFLIVGVFVAYFGILDDASGPGAIVNPFTSRAIINLIISATWAYVSYMSAVRRLARKHRM